MKKILDNKGFVSVFALIVMAVLLPFLIFVFVDMSHVRYAENKLQHVTDNACSSASMALDEQALKEGKVVVDEDKATQMVKDIMQSQLSLDENLNPIKGRGMLYEKPNITLKIYNNVPKEGYTIKTSKRDIKINNTSVALCVDYPVHLAFFKNMRFNVSKISVKEVKL